jgi:hypothetical protein
MRYLLISLARLNSALDQRKKLTLDSLQAIVYAAIHPVGKHEVESSKKLGLLHVQL